jgi:DNA-binding response OmpR family regulator
MSKTLQAQKHILVVEDDTSLADAYGLILESSDFIVTKAKDGDDALKIISDNTYDLILLDLKMPRMDGVTFLKNYRVTYPDSTTKVVVFSNYDFQDEVKQAYELGIDKYFLKSWAAPRDLIKIINEVLSR